MLIAAEESQLVLIDFQQRLLPAIHESAAVLANAQWLAQAAGVMGVPVWSTEQSPDKLGLNDGQLRAASQRTLVKTHFSACEEGLVEWLRPAVKAGGNARSLPKHLQKAVPTAPAGRNSLVLAGCEAHVCLLQTALDLLDEEFDVWVVTDACGSRAERSRDAAFDRLAGNGAELVTTEMVIFEWLRDARHPEFRRLQAMIK